MREQDTEEMRRVRVDAIRTLGQDIRAFDLVPADGRPLRPAGAGAHIDVYTPSGALRQYSLCGDAGGRGYTIAVKREANGRGGSANMHDAVTVGDAMGIAGPRNHFPLTPSAGYSMLVAGGIGITPIYAMIHELEAAGRAWELHYCARSAQCAAFHEELTSRYPDRVHTYFSEEPLLDVEELTRALDDGSRPADTHLYCCGPAGLMQAVRDAVPAADAARVHFEWFAAPVSAAPAVNQPFEVQLASSGLVVQVPADRSLLRTLMDHGVLVQSSCESGVCGTCETRVLSGEIDHRDALLSEEERQTGQSMMVCVSRARRGRIVLDL